MYTFGFANPFVLLWLLPIVILAVIAHWYFNKSIVYRHPLAQTVISKGWQSNHPHQKIYSFGRICIVLLLVFLCAKPRFVDLNSKLPTHGIDIILALDVSGSMFNITEPGETRSRFAIAQDEAIKFIYKRTNDALGLVLFADDVLSRCPLTHDKSMLVSLIKDINRQEIPLEGTKLSQGILVAVNRLKNAQSKSKVIILLTDGEPSQGDIDPQIAIQAAKQYGIKIYTIGIGSEEPRPYIHPMWGQIGIIPPVNKALLDEIACQTGGQAFLAHNAKDMHEIYDTIDTLETTEHEIPIFSHFYDIYVPFVIIIMVWLLVEIVLKTFVWFGI